MRVLATVTLHAHGRTRVEAEDSTFHMISGDAIVFTVPADLDIKVEHPEMLRMDPVPREPGLRARLRRFYWGVRKAWRESNHIQPCPRMTVTPSAPPSD